jgi:hypothetical protein
VLLEGEPRRSESGTCARRTRRMLAYESLKMLVRRSAIAARLFQFGERQQCVIGVGR